MLRGIFQNIVTDQLPCNPCGACCAAGVRVDWCHAQTADSARHKLATWLSLSPVSPRELPQLTATTNSPRKKLFTESEGDVYCSQSIHINIVCDCEMLGFWWFQRAHWPDRHPWGPGGATVTRTLARPSSSHLTCVKSLTMDVMIGTMVKNLVYTSVIFYSLGIVFGCFCNIFVILKTFGKFVQSKIIALSWI